MLSRRSVRIKAMQLLFSATRDKSLTFNDLENRYWNSIQSTFDLYCYNLYILERICSYTREDLKNRKTKYLPSEYDKKFSIKLYDNDLIQSLVQNEELQNYYNRAKFDSVSNADYHIKIYTSFSKIDEFKEYVLNESTHESHVNMLLDLYRHCRQNELYNEMMEDYNPQWIDDKSVVIGAIKKTIKELPPSELDFINKYYPDDLTVKEFGFNLFKLTFEKDKELLDQIKPILKNWDHERLAIIDMIVLKLALTEFKHFDSIPPTVSINEYLEIVKKYSTAKSKEFINGVLDRLKGDFFDDGDPELKKIDDDESE